MNQKEIEAYKAGFLNGIDLKENYKVQIMGYDLFKIFDILEKHMTHEKKKMTRAEAIACFKEHMPWAKDADRTVDFYIEAGMLEIVEEKQEENPLVSFEVETQLETVIHFHDPLRNIHTDQRGKLSPNGGQLLINQLAKLGYKIIKA